jgi:hypothetical protein
MLLSVRLWSRFKVGVLVRLGVMGSGSLEPETRKLVRFVTLGVLCGRKSEELTRVRGLGWPVATDAACGRVGVAVAVALTLEVVGVDA